MSHEWEDWTPETGSSVTLEEYKNERVLELVYKFTENYEFTRAHFEDIMALIGISTTLEELKGIKI